MARVVEEPPSSNQPSKIDRHHGRAGPTLLNSISVVVSRVWKGSSPMGIVKKGRKMSETDACTVVVAVEKM
jgi:hypothetical protein